jgi:hypothetical protein
VEKAVERVLRKGMRTSDLAAKGGPKPVSCRAMGDAVAAEIR